MPTLTERALSGLRWSAGATVLRVVLQVAVLAVLARLILPAEFGAFHLALSLAAFSGALGELGVGAALVQRSRVTDDHVRAAVVLSVGLGVVVALLLVGLAPLFATLFRSPELVLLLRVLAASFVVSSLTVVPQALAQRGMEFRRIARIQLVSYLLGYGGVGLLLAFAGSGLWSLVGAHVTQTVLLAVMFLRGSRRIPARLPALRSVRELLSFGGLWTVARGLNAVAVRADDLVVARWLGSHSLGLYGRAYQLMTLPANLFADAAEKVAFPAMAQVQEEPRRMQTAYRRGVVMTAVLVLPVSATVLVLAPEIVHVLLGPRWAAVTPLLRVFAVAMYFRTAYKISGTVVRASGAVDALAVRQGMYVVFSVGGALVGQRYGVTGVAGGVSLAVVLHFLFLSQLALRTVAMPWRKFLAAHSGPAILALIAGVVAWLTASAVRAPGVGPLPVLIVTLGAVAAATLLAARIAPERVLGADALWWRRSVVDLVRSRAGRLLGALAAAKPLHRLIPRPVPPEARRRIAGSRLPSPVKGLFLAGIHLYSRARSSLLQRLMVLSADVVVVSFPKCGRTWLRMMVGRAVQLHFGLDDANPFKLTELRQRGARMPRITFTHDDEPQWKSPAELESSKRRYSGKRVVLLVRDPRDVVVSMYFQSVKREYAYEGTLSSFIREPRGSFETVVAFYNTWAASRRVPEQLLLLRYEDLRAAPEAEMRRLLEFIGLSGVSDDTIRSAVEFAAFDNMRQMEERNSLGTGALRPGDIQDRSSFKTRRGQVGGFVDYLGEEEVEELSRRLRLYLDPMFGYEPDRRADGAGAGPAGKPVVPGQHVMFITQVNPYTPVAGTSVVLRNLISAFDPASYTVAFLGRFRWRSREVKRPACDRLIPNYHPVQFLDFVFRGIKERYAIRRAVRLVRRRNVQIIVGLYPTLRSLRVATEVAKRTNVRFFPYLHDTVAEGLSHLPMADDARTVQAEVFRTAEKILTMSEGMSDFYRRVYGLETFPLQHSFPEKIARKPSFQRARSALWGGAVYGINDQSFSRVQKALHAAGTELEVTSLNPLSVATGLNVRQSFYPSRREYLEAVQRHGIVVLALNWPDETSWDEAELSTIFPTKAIEYLATGSPILVHCPDHYFLAKFFRRHDCGIVVPERSEAALREAIASLQAGGSEIRAMQERALATTDFFSISRVSSLLQAYLGAGAGRSVRLRDTVHAGAADATAVSTREVSEVRA